MTSGASKCQSRWHMNNVMLYCATADEAIAALRATKAID